MSEIIPLERIHERGAAILLSYPKLDPEEVLRRVEEARELGVEAIELRGRHLINGLPVLGKGHTGVVIAVKTRSGEAALKIRRVDADRASFRRGAEMLRIANEASVGPRLIGASDNLILMELVEGQYLTEWLSKPDFNAGCVKRTLRRLLDMARRLDLKGLDHGELSRAHRHILIAGEEPMILDFESSSTLRRASNITSLIQYLFINERNRRLLEVWLKLPERSILLKALKNYKRTLSEDDYNILLSLIDLN
ncbi:hypothetical protein KEJ49_00015 [Candidatus Bathyarchaeota archaeon]|nr:hypothetical protein [Candidatus Bathyarchaeota archaeon]